MADMTKPRKKRHELSDITNQNQRAVAEIVKPVIESSGLTMKQFASLEPSQSLTILNRMFNPDTNGVETPKTYRTLAKKCAKINNKLTPEDYYKELMEAANLDYETKYPFNPESVVISVMPDATIKSELMPVIINLAIPCKMPKSLSLSEHETENNGHSKTRPFHHELICDYSSSDNAPIDYWALDFCTGIATRSLAPIHAFFYMILRESASQKIKYSLVTDSKALFDFLISMNIPVLNVIVSAIFFDGETFTEAYIKTGLDHSEIDKAGLSL